VASRGDPGLEEAKWFLMTLVHHLLATPLLRTQDGYGITVLVPAPRNGDVDELSLVRLGPADVLMT